MSKNREISSQNESSNDSQKTIVLNEILVAAVNKENARPLEVDNNSTDQIIQSNIDQVILLAASLKASNDRDKLAKRVDSIRLSLLKIMPQIDDDGASKAPGTSFNDPPLDIKEFSFEESFDNVVIENNAMVEEAPIVTKVEMMEDPLLIDPIRLHIERLEKFGMEITKKAMNWRQTKETDLKIFHAVLKESDKEWKDLMLKFEICPEKSANLESDSDASIDRLCNLNSLRRKSCTNDKKCKSPRKRKLKQKKGLDIEALVKEAMNANDSEEETLVAPPLVSTTEAEFLKKANEEAKRQLLENSDSEDMEDSSNVGTKLPNIDSGVEENSPIHTPDNSKTEDDDPLDLSMFKKECEALENVDAQLEADLTSVLNVSDIISLISDSEEENTPETPAQNRGIRKIMSEAELAAETKAAQTAEEKREERLNEMSQNMAQILSQNQDLENEFVLDYDKKNNQAITVHPDIVKKLKPHQKEGVRFMYNNCYGPIDDIEKYPGSGCILAHCMGLGKTLQLIALLHTIIRYPRLKTNKILVLCPKSTIMNWFEEFERWISTIKKTRKMKVFYFPKENMTITQKTKILLEWHESGIVKEEQFDDTGLEKARCLLLGYETFRSLVNYKPRGKNAHAMNESTKKHFHDTIEKCLIEPGADIVVCDEGHVIKNRRSGISQAVSQIKTKRRIILTGTPIQNNLNEYYCMVNWIKPSFLGTEKEFNNRYANPIKQGQHKDSTRQEIRQMMKRSFLLHQKLQNFVERKEITVLKDELPEKHEYVIYVPLTEVQTNLYKVYLEHLKRPLEESDNIKGTRLLPEYTYLRKIWTHPRVLESAFETSRKNQNKKTTKMFERNLDKLIERCDEEDLPDDVFDIGGTKASVPQKWWELFVKPVHMDTLVSSYKMQVLIKILRQCNEMGDKCLIFSNFVAVLKVVEYFLQSCLQYVPGHCYYCLDGQTPKAKRHAMITKFNREDNQDVKCFLISAGAGGQGINLIGANRVIILDTSWNPAADLQSIFRVYRLGQKKTCYVYRLLAFGTMEEKVYSRSVTKQAMSNRVVDEMQVDRHFSYGELAELYTLTECDMEKRPMPGVPVDSVLKNLLRSYPQFIYKFHEHDSLLASNDDEELSEQEKADACKALEDEEREQNNTNVIQDMPSMSLEQMTAFLVNYYKNNGNVPNMNMLSQLMFNMDPYHGQLNNLPGLTSPSKDQTTGTTNPLSKMNPLRNKRLNSSVNKKQENPGKKTANLSPAVNKRKETPSTSHEILENPPSKANQQKPTNLPKLPEEISIHKIPKKADVICGRDYDEQKRQYRRYSMKLKEPPKVSSPANVQTPSTSGAPTNIANTKKTSVQNNSYVSVIPTARLTPQSSANASKRSSAVSQSLNENAENPVKRKK